MCAQNAESAGVSINACATASTTPDCNARSKKRRRCAPQPHRYPCYQSRRDYNVRHGRRVRRCAARRTSLCAASTHMIQQSSGLSARTGGSVLNFRTIARRRWSKKSTLVPTSLQLSRRHRAVARRGVGSDSAVPTRVRGSSAQLDRRMEGRRAAPSHSGAVSVLRRNRKPEVHTHGCHSQAGHGRAGSCSRRGCMARRKSCAEEQRAAGTFVNGRVRRRAVHDWSKALGASGSGWGGWRAAWMEEGSVGWGLRWGI